MTADTETIREALEEMCPYLERKVASFPDDGFARLRFERAAAALAALGRVEERELVLSEHLEVAHREWEKEQMRRLELQQAAEVMASYLRIGQTRPPEYVLEFFRRIHDLPPAALTSAAGSGEE